MKYLLFIMKILVSISLIPIIILTVVFSIALIAILIPVILLWVILVIPPYILSKLHELLIKYNKTDNTDIIEIIKEETCDD